MSTIRVGACYVNIWSGFLPGRLMDTRWLALRLPRTEIPFIF